MVARIGEWIELSFWHLTVRVLSGARPFSHGLQRIQHSITARPIQNVFSNAWLIAGAGWMLGLILGIVISGWI